MKRTISVIMALGLSVSAQAQMGPPGGGPPPEAFTACADKASGDTCSHPIPSGTMTGACQPRGDRLQCIPSRGGPPGSGPQQGGNARQGGGNGPQLDAQGNELGPPSPRYSFATLPVPAQRMRPQAFTLPDGRTHWYEVVFLPQGGVNWVQAKSLAEQAGGYLVTLHSKAENDFVFSLIADEKYWFKWGFTHNFVMNGPFLGGFQPVGSAEPKGGWRWVTDEPWSYENWAWDGMPGDRDPRNNTQPNDSTGNQNVLAFGEVNEPVSTWGDFPQKFSSFQSEHDGKALGFIIEYDHAPF